MIVTAGGHGLAAAMADGESFALPARQVSVVSSHGAGDCFIGSLAAALAKGEGLRLACERASDAAARHVSQAAP